jgi:phasin
MTQNSKAPFELPSEMLAFTEQSIDDARAAFEKIMGMAQTTLGAAEARSKAAQDGARDISAKVMEFAERNVADAFAYAQKLVHARDPQALVQLHADFVQSQIKTLMEQSQALAEAAGQAARSAAEEK